MQINITTYLKWPWPIEKVHWLDQRVQNLESKFEETLTADGFNLLVQVYVGWKITEPATFFPKFVSGSVGEAEKTLQSLVRSAKNEVVGRHPFSHFISTDPKELQFAEMEKEMLAKKTSKNQITIPKKIVKCLRRLISTWNGRGASSCSNR